MRTEFIMASAIGQASNAAFVEEGESQKFVDKFAERVATVAREIQPKPVVVRFSDFKTNEYRRPQRRRQIRNRTKKTQCWVGEAAADT